MKLKLKENEKAESVIDFLGLRIAIEFPGGSTKKGVNKKTGEEWTRDYHHDYGYIVGSYGADGDNLDCFLCPDRCENSEVFIVQQLTPDGSRYDEDKCMIGYASEEDAIEAFKLHCHLPDKMFGGITPMSIDDFLDQLEEFENTPVKLENQVYAVDARNGETLFEFSNWSKAEEWKKSLPEKVIPLYEIRTNLPNGRLIREGLAHGDLVDILVPQVSIDEYQSKENTNNVVVAFYIHNVPEAIEPLRRFCDRCPGVVDTDTGDSDTLRNTSIVYCEFKRKNIRFEQISRMIELIARIAGLKHKDISLSFPSGKHLYTYSPEIIAAYFTKMIAIDIKKEKEKERNEKENSDLKKINEKTEIYTGEKFWYNTISKDHETFAVNSSGSQHHLSKVKEDPRRFGILELPEKRSNISNDEYSAEIVFLMLENGWIRGSIVINGIENILSLEVYKLRDGFATAKWASRYFNLKLTKIYVDVRKSEELSDITHKVFNSLEDYRKVLVN